MHPTLPRAGHRTARQLLKTIVASQAAFWLDFGILALLTEAAGLHYLASAAIAFLAGTTVSYVLSIVWVFTETLGLHYLISKILAATLIFGWNFGARKLLLFR